MHLFFNYIFILYYGTLSRFNVDYGKLNMQSLIKKFGKINSSVLALCLLFLILEVIGHRHGETSIEDIIFFPAFFGFLSCIIIFKIGVSLRAFLMKKEDYYDR